MCLTGTISFDVKNKAPISASGAKESIYFIICAIVKKGPFQRVMGKFSDRKIWPPALFLGFFSLLKPES